LVVDVGNTRLRAGRFAGAHLAAEWSGAYDQERPRWSVAWRRFLQQLPAHGPLPVRIASVAPRRADVVQRALRDCGFTQVHRVTHADAWPFACDIDALYMVGIDRLANVAGAMALGLQSAIAVDLGTAITIDAILSCRTRSISSSTRKASSGRSTGTRGRGVSQRNSPTP
jgi:pantothenate kinase type III